MGAELGRRIPLVDVSPRIDACQDFDPKKHEELKDVSINLYEKRKKIQPKSILGFFQKIRAASLWSIMGLYLLVPWMQWNDKQAVLFDLPARQFHIFEVTFWPQDFFLLACLLIIAAFALFFVTAIAGRVFCGYACPQSVWTLFFLWIEKIVEGDRNARLKLDKEGMNAKKVMLRSIKHSLWLALAFLTGLTFVGYFYGIKPLIYDIFTLDVYGWPLFWTLFFTAATYINAGWMREQVCKYMCPYARFQSVMFDNNTLIVSYDEERGEPRGRGKKRNDDKGDCVSCGLCVQVCPTGIDIRNGLQYECITCAACIDVCDDVMTKLGREKGLIRYTTDNALKHIPSNLFSPRIIAYGIALALMTALFLFALFSRTPVDVELIRDRGSLYKHVAPASIKNNYTLKVYNMSQKDQVYRVSFKPEYLKLNRSPLVTVKAGEKRNLPISIVAPREKIKGGSSEIEVMVQSQSKASIKKRHKGTFIAPL